jgi:hypothetical protein
MNDILSFLDHRLTSQIITHHQAFNNTQFTLVDTARGKTPAFPWRINEESLSQSTMRQNVPFTPDRRRNFPPQQHDNPMQ